MDQETTVWEDMSQGRITSCQANDKPIPTSYLFYRMSSNSNLPDLEIHEVGIPLKRGGSAAADLASKHTKQLKQEEQITIPSLTASRATNQVSNNNSIMQSDPEVIEKKKKVDT